MGGVHSCACATEDLELESKILLFCAIALVAFVTGTLMFIPHLLDDDSLVMVVRVVELSMFVKL